MQVYRIIKADHKQTPFSTVGAELYPGRWNPAGVGILYTSTSPELALLEKIVHLDIVPFSRLPRLWLMCIELPGKSEVGDSPLIRYLSPTDLPPDWNQPGSTNAQTFLGEWFEKPDTLGIGVPSVVMNISYNILLHPKHPLFDTLTIRHAFDYTLDTRLWQRVGKI
jgi:RES domain-containing protein